MPAGSLTVPDEAAAPLRRTDDVRQALAALWPHFLWAGLFSSAINLLYLSSPLYLMQVYNRVLLNENISTLVLRTLILAISLLTMAALDAVRASILIRCGIRIDMKLWTRVFEAQVERSAQRVSFSGAQQS